MKKFQIAVIGSAGSQEYQKGGFNFQELFDLSYQIGKLLAKKGCIVITGGKSGIMEGAAKGCKEGGGINIGFVKGQERGVCNEFVDIEIVTNMGDGGDAFLIPYSADAAIIIGGGVGTLKEISGFYLQGKPLVALENTGGRADKFANSFIDEREIIKIIGCNSPEECVNKILKQLS